MATVTRDHEPQSDRYRYDFALAHFKDGWAQFDTRQDASYYGNWINPLKLELLSFCEGDVTHTKCADEAEFIALVHERITWHRQTFEDPKAAIDGMCSPPIIDAFTRMGLGAFLH